MELNLTEIGQTLAVGALLIVVTGVWLSVLFQKPMLPYRLLGEKSPYKFAASAILLASILALGIIAEDISKSVVGQPPPTILKSIAQLHVLLPEDAELRSEAVFDRNDNNVVLPWRAKGISHEMADRGVLSRYGGEKGPALSAALKAGTKEFRTDDIVPVVGSVFYQAKNVLYQQDKYFTELRRIESRIDFTRSFCFSCATLIAIGGLLCILRLFIGIVWHYVARSREIVFKSRKQLARYEVRRNRARRRYQKNSQQIEKLKEQRARNRSDPTLNRTIAGLSRQQRLEWKLIKRCGLLLKRPRRFQICVRWFGKISTGKAFPIGRLVQRIVLTFALLACGCALASMAFRSEQFSYNVRVFGYFSSLHDKSWGGPFAPTSLPTIPANPNGPRVETGARSSDLSSQKAH